MTHIHTDGLTEDGGAPDIHTYGKTNRRGGDTGQKVTYIHKYIHTYGKTNTHAALYS